MIETLFILALAALIAAVIDRWRSRPVLVVSTRSGESFRGRRAPSLRFVLDDAELILDSGHRPGEHPNRVVKLGGRVMVPRRNVTVVQALTEEQAQAQLARAEA